MMALLIVVSIAIIAAVSLGHSPSHQPKTVLVTKPRHPSPLTLPAAESGLLPWQLAAPISRIVVVPGTGNQLVLLGGLTTNNVSSASVFTLDTTNGALTQIGDLTGPLHDAAAAVVGGRDMVFGGGASTTVATVQAFPAPGSVGTPAGSSGSSASTVSSLPAPRSDAAVTTVGSTTYLVGGYDGTNADASVLATTDGRTFRAVASLPVPVRYPAVAALGARIYVFGGEAITGPGAGQPIDDIQMIDTADRRRLRGRTSPRDLERRGGGDHRRPHLRGRRRELGAPELGPRRGDHRRRHHPGRRQSRAPGKRGPSPTGTRSATPPVPRPSP